ncbi:MAG: DUF177 domain-containing protein [Bacteroidales bacterium]|jgi:uncharacterized metal-binding protein YceD (DUF177 family)|nr:DUF177 domain-containing protein [Bacteroidales bacterium]
MDYKIQISGLAQGKHDYEFPVKGDFFREFDNSQIKDASLVAKVELDKGSGWMNVSCNVVGTVVTECDRCLDDLEIPMDFTADVAVKAAKLGEKTESTDEFLIIDPSEGELDLKQFIYDYICVNLPLKKVHEEGKCNPKMLKKLQELKGKEDAAEDKETYAPFSGLDKLLKEAGKKKK